MCGIAGYWDVRGFSKSDFRNELTQAVTSLHHRGPDDSGLWFNDQGVGLGHARLSILDLSQHGHQPMVSDDGRYIMVFNGEIYNFRQIRKDLKAKGFSFRGSGDSEVVLAAFEAWGVECVQRFIGMFAFAVWDDIAQKILLFRDRIGVKPLYYGWDGEVFWFGSELKALRAFKHWTPEVNHQAMGEFFQYAYIAAPRTIYANVHKLLPGHYLELHRDQPEPILKQYWSILDAIEKGTLEGSEDDLTDQLESLMIDAFQYRMVSDVPVGVFLSGGIDSSLVTALLQAHSDTTLHTYTLGFREKSFDESGWAKKVADHLGTEHTEYILSQDDATPILSELSDIYDEPFGDPSALPTLLVSRLAKEDVKVVLSADGGDELFGGYSYYQHLPLQAQRLNKIPTLFKQMIGGVCSYPSVSLLSYLSDLGGSFGTDRVSRRMMQLSEVLPDCSPEMVFSNSHSYWFPREIDALFGGYSSPYSNGLFHPGTFEEQMMLWDIQHYHPDDILVKMDRATMSTGLEGREPLLDHRLVEFAYRLPLKYRLGELGSKHILRKILYKYVPRELIERPKQGFALPVNRWLQGAFGATMCDEILQTAEAAGLNLPQIKHELRISMKSGRYPMRVWLLYIYTSWFRKWMM